MRLGIAMRLLYALVAVGLLKCNAKSQRGTIRSLGSKTGSTWRYVSKFGFMTGEYGTWRFKVRREKPAQILPPYREVELLVYLDEVWSNVSKIPVGCERVSLAKDKLKVNLSDVETMVQGTVRQHIRPHIWYFAIADCRSDDELLVPMDLQFEFSAIQPDNSEFSVEMQGMLRATLLFFCVYNVFSFWMCQKTLAFSRSAGCVHPVIKGLIASFALLYVGKLLYALHLWRYAWNGHGVFVLEVLSAVLNVVSHMLYTTLLMLIALGYTILQSNVGRLDAVVLLSSVVAVLHVMLVVIGKFQGDSGYKYHENEGVVGWILMCLHLAMCVAFGWSVQLSLRACALKSQAFLQRFRVAGALYFFAYPAIFLFTKIFAPYVQHRVMSWGVMSMSLLSTFWLASLFLTRSEYFSTSSLSDSLLPGFASLKAGKDE